MTPIATLPMPGFTGVERHVLPFPVGMCPISGMPLAGSTLTIEYHPAGLVLDVIPLATLLESYVGGLQDGADYIRNMEEVPAHIARRAAAGLGVSVRVHAHIVLLGDQVLELEVSL